MKSYDAIIIGGGFFGLSIAGYIREHCGQKNVLVIEKENDFMLRASYNNQARVHGGYHYPRSLLTGLRSQANFDRFLADYKLAIVSDFTKHYAVAHNFSKVSARQFKLFCDRIGAELGSASKEVKQLFNSKLIEDVFVARETAFNAKILKEQLLKDLEAKGVELLTRAEVVSVSKDGGRILVERKAGSSLHARRVFNCTYSLINKINKNSNLPFIPLKHELTEMCLVELPKKLKNLSVTVMCGPFFSLMPFPDKKGLSTLSHVRYTPHSEWQDQSEIYRDGHEYLDKDVNKTSHFPQMISDVSRYIPAMKDTTYKGSLWEIKTVLPQSEQDDSRPILFRRDHGIKGYTCIMGGKLDNIYDAFKELDEIYA